MKRSKWEDEEEPLKAIAIPAMKKRPLSKSVPKESIPQPRGSLDSQQIISKRSSSVVPASAIQPSETTLERSTSNAFKGPPILSCRSVTCYEKLNKIDEGSYGIVYRARDKETGEIYALKRLKLEQEKSGFPITSLREIYALLLAKHENIVNVKEIVTTPNLARYVKLGMKLILGYLLLWNLWSMI